MPYKDKIQKNEYYKIKMRERRAEQKDTNINTTNIYKFYKIVCKNIKIKDCYIGSTIDIDRREKEHKYSVTNTDDDTKIYKFIRENGGWNNWSLILIDTKLCVNKKHVLTLEQFYIETFKANLNTNKCIKSASLLSKNNTDIIIWKTRLTKVLIELNNKLFVLKPVLIKNNVVPIIEKVVPDSNPFVYDIMRFELLFDTIRMQELLLRKTRFNVWMNYHLSVLEELQIYFNKKLI